MPGAAVATMSSTPAADQAVREPAQAVVLEVVDEGVGRA